MTSTFDNEFDSFFNLDSEYNAGADVKPSLTHNTSSVSSIGPFSVSSQQQSFSAPSYAYDSHRQQTGLPIGGLANTFAVNQAAGLQYRPNSMGFVMPTETLNVPLTGNVDEFDFNQNMDFEVDSPTDVSSMPYTTGESSTSAPIQRVYPGMHSQQAAQAKAAQAQRQQEMLRESKPIPGQRPLPPTTAAKAPAPKDPQVEESITRILSKMRQSSSASVEDATHGSGPGMSGIPKPKKEEDDMDEDERLLASEEGKKLSSKERRQLRNKVSARAFRSRRKEYIGQLEGELQTKVQEAHELRVQNQQLMEENTRLTDLTRMLLSSNAFSGFLQELSQSGGTVPAIPATSQAPRPGPTPKDVPVHDISRHLPDQNQQVGVTMIPEPNVDMSGLENQHNRWNHLPPNDFQVYAVTALPTPVERDFTSLGDKESKIPSVSGKYGPVLSELPPTAEMCQPPSAEATPTILVGHGVDDADDFYPRPVASSATACHTAEALIESLTKSDNTSFAPQPRTLDRDERFVLIQRCADLDDTCRRLDRFFS